MEGDEWKTREYDEGGRDSLFTVHYSLLASSAADKLHNLVTIAFGHAGLAPRRPRQNPPIALDGHAAAVDAQRFQKLRNRSARSRFPNFSIHDDRNIFTH